MTENQFKESDLIRTYNFLGHKQQTELRLIDPQNKEPPKIVFVNNLDEFLSTTKKWNGKYNIYAGINERKNNGTTRDDVTSVKTIVIDIDPVRSKNVASTDTELESCKNKARTIIEDCKKYGFKKPAVVSSGNGIQLWFAIPETEINDANRDKTEQQLQKFQELFKNKYSDTQNKIDKIGDLPRIIKVIGSLSIKGENTIDRPFRVSQALEDFERNEDTSLKEEILSYHVSIEETINLPEPSPKTKEAIKKIIMTDTKTKALLDGNLTGYMSRSEAEQAILCQLIKNDIPKEQIYEIMQQCKIGKWQEAHPSYRERSYVRAKEWVAKKYEPGLLSISGVDKAEHADLADQIMTKVHFITPAETDTLYFYKDGVYVSLAEAWIKAIIEEITIGEATRHLVLEVIDAIKRRTYCSLEEIDSEPELLSVKNGILNVKTRELKPHNPGFKTFVQLPTSYDSNATCPLFLQFIDQIMSAEDTKLVQEMFGYCLYRQYLWHKAIMLTGAGSNGKSTLLSVLKKLLGVKNIMSTSIQDLEYNRFSKAELFKKLANICPDLPPKVLSGTGTFKSLTGNDTVTAERKGCNPFTFNNYAKLLFSANQIPSAEDDSDAFYRRWIIIRFGKQFSKETADPHLIGKISTDSELSGILNWALDGLQRMFEQSGFSENQTLEEVRDKYIHLSNPVRAFVTDCISFDDYEDFVTKEALFSAYCNYCKNRHLPLISDSGIFVKKILSEFPTNVTSQKRLVDGIRKHCFTGLSLIGQTVSQQILPLSEKNQTTTSSVLYTKIPPVTHNVQLVQRGNPRHISCLSTDVVEEEVIKDGVGNMLDTVDTMDNDSNKILQQISKIPTSFEHLENIFCKSLDWPVEQLNKTLLLLKQNGDVLENKPGYYVKLE
jgi:putative DNA primase/helicase